MTSSTTPRPGRNEPCHCGSGRKYKQCCLPKDEAEAATARAAAAAEAGPAAADASSATSAAPKHKTQQPWKAATSRGFVPRSTAPRKMGGG
ncbi:MAG: SEC-C metal-binding domain-containing protein [Vicinamibacteraceae bacterium]